MLKTIRIMLCLSLLQGIGVAAQESTEEEDALLQIYGGKDMISIATGSKQPVSKAPAVASVVTAEEIKAIGATDLDEVLETVPGLHVARSALGYNPIYTVRGVYSNYNPQVLVLINGIPITNLYVGDRNRTWGGMPVQAIARIEVIRGPGSALYGADAFAGVINIITKTKEDINGTELGARAGSFDTYDGWALHGGTWAGFDVAAMVEIHETEGYRRTIEADAQTGLDQVLGTHASLAPGPVNLQRDNIDARLDLSRGHWRLRAGLQSRANRGNGVGTAQALDPVNRAGSDRWNADLTYHNPAFTENWDVTAQLSYFDTSQTQDRNLTLYPPGTKLPIGADGNIDFTHPLGLVTFPQGYIGNPEVFERHGRFNLSGFYTGFDRHTLRIGAGLNYSNLYKAQVTQNFGLDPMTGQPIPFLPGPPLEDVSGTPSTFIRTGNRKDYFLFVQDEWRFANDWGLTTGVRYDHYSDFGDTANPRLALVWDTRYDLTTKLLYGRAFRAPSFAETRAINNPVALGNPDLQPETMDTAELAFDYRPTGNLRLGLNLFQYWWDDIIRFVPDPGAVTATAQNTGEQTGHGLELEMDWKVADTVRLTGNYAFQHSTDQQTGRDAGYAPHHQIYLRADWEFLPNWHAAPQFTWVGDRERAFGDDRSPVGDYGLVDLTLRRKRIKDHFEVAFSVRNLLDTDVREPSLAGRTAASIPYDLPQAGRSFFGEVRFAF
jgi:outer membrane receptor protein involved in Fe transport